MKTSGFRCETKFGLLVFLGHPNVNYDGAEAAKCHAKKPVKFGSRCHFLSTNSVSDISKQAPQPAADNVQKKGNFLL